MKKTAILRPVVKHDTSNQLDIFSARECATGNNSVPVDSVSSVPVIFNEPNPEEILLNQLRLDKHLKQSGQVAPLQIRSLLWSLDWQAFEVQYKPGGRPSYSPRAMMGIIFLYVIRGQATVYR